MGGSARQGKASSVSRTLSTCSVPVDHLYMQEIFSKTHSCINGKLKRIIALVLFGMVGRRR